MRTREEFIEQLRAQLSFLKASCAHWDGGNRREGVRIAAIVRTLVHDGHRNSVSLLTHLNARGIRLLSSVEKLNPWPANPGKAPIWRSWQGMGVVTIGTNSGFGPAEVDHSWRRVSVDEWWGEVIYILGDLNLTRRELVLNAAETDGGVHVDKSLKPKYEEVSSSGFVGILGTRPADGLPPLTGLSLGHTGEEHPITDAHLVFLRQIGAELLNSKELLNLSL